MYTDITTRYKETVIDVLYNLLKPAINWTSIQALVPSKLFLYSNKKKCQLLLALADCTTMATRFNDFDQPRQTATLKRTMKQIGFLRSLEYIKAFRKFNLLNLFDAIPDFDTILKQTKYSIDDSVAFTYDITIEVITEMANNSEKLVHECIEKLPDHPVADKDELEGYFRTSATIGLLTQQLSDIAERLNCNHARTKSNFISALFDIESLIMVAFDPHYINFQSDMNEWDKLYLKKHVSTVVERVMKDIQDMTKVEFEESFRMNKEYNIREHVYNFNILDEDNNIHIEFEFSNEDPLIIEN